MKEIDTGSFGNNLAALMKAAEMPALKQFLDSIFAPGLPAEKAAVFEAEAMCVSAFLPGVSHQVLASLVDGFGWRENSNNIAAENGDMCRALLRRLDVAALKETLRWQAGQTRDPGFAIQNHMRSPGARRRRAAAVVIGRGEPAGGLKSIPWTPLLYDRWLEQIHALSPVSYDYFDRIRINWLRMRRDVIGDLAFARAMMISGLIIPPLTWFMCTMIYNNQYLPDWEVGFTEAVAGIALVFVPLYRLLSRLLPG